MFRKVNLLIALLATVLVMATSAAAQYQPNPCNCANASLVGDTVGTRFNLGPGPINKVVGTGIELPGAGPVLGGAGPSPRWNIDYGSNTIRVDFLQQPATYGMGSYFTFSSLDPQLPGCPAAFISGITVTTNKPTVPFNVVSAATFGPHTVTIQIAPPNANLDWQPGEFILVKLNFACDTQTPQCPDLNTATGQPGWMLASGPGVTVPKVPVSVSPYSGWNDPPLPGSSWVSVDANRGNLPGDYTYTFPFCLCNEGKHVLNLSFYADNGAKVFLNNTQIFATTGSSNFSGAPKVVNYSWSSAPGPNTISIVVSNQSLVTGLNAILKITGAAHCGCQETKSQSRSVKGRVVDPRNNPVSGVEVGVPGRAAVLTNSKGEFEIRDLQTTERLAVSFSATGFMNTTKIFRVGESPGPGTVVVVWPRAAPVSLDAVSGGKLSFAGGGGVTIPPNSLVDSDGRRIRGQVMVSLTQLDVSDRDQLRTMAGDFRAQMSDKSIRMLESFGVFEIAAVDARGQRVDLAPGKTARFDLPAPRTPRERASKRTRLFSFDTVSGFWIEEGEVVLTEQLVYSGTITRFDWEWNVDNPLDTTCITVKFIDVFGANTGPIANALVEATGVTYNTISSGYTNSQGLVCLLVKINSAITIKAYDPNFTSTFIGPLNVTSPNIVSGASDCGDSTLCPLIITVEQDARLLTPAPYQVLTARSLSPRYINLESLPTASPFLLDGDRLSLKENAGGTHEKLNRLTLHDLQINGRSRTRSLTISSRLRSSLRCRAGASRQNGALAILAGTKGDSDSRIQCQIGAGCRSDQAIDRRNGEKRHPGF